MILICKRQGSLLNLPFYLDNGQLVFSYTWEKDCIPQAGLMDAHSFEEDLISKMQPPVPSSAICYKS